MIKIAKRNKLITVDVQESHADKVPQQQRHLTQYCAVGLFSREELVSYQPFDAAASKAQHIEQALHSVS